MIGMVEEMKYLWMWFTKHNSKEGHIRQRAKKALEALKCGKRKDP